MPDGEWQRLSHAALVVREEQARLCAGERAAAVVAHELAIRVDGRPQRFLAGRCGDGWAAVAMLAAYPGGEKLTVLVTAEQVAPEAVVLERVRDVEPYLPGPPA